MDASTAAETQRVPPCRRAAVLRRLAVALALFSVLALAAGVVAVVQAYRAGQPNEQARSRQLAAEARLLAATNVEAALRRAVDAYRTAPTQEARSVLLSMAGTQGFHGRLTGHAGAINALALTPDGTTMVSGGQDGTAIVWDVERQRGGPLRPRPPAAGPGRRHRRRDPRRGVPGGRAAAPVASRPDGTGLYSGSTDRTIIPWTIDIDTAQARIEGQLS